MKTIIKDVQGLVASLFPSIHRVASPSHRHLRLSLITLLLTLGVGQMWGAPSARYYLIGDPKGDWNKAEDYKIKTRYEKDGQYVFYIYANSNAYFRLMKDDNANYGPSTNGETNQGYGAYNENAWKYNGNAGIVRFGVDETAGDNGEHYPWVFWGKVDIKIKHNWNNEGSWTEQSMTTNSNGTYTYKGLYSGSNATNFGIGSDGTTMKYITNATLVGSPAQGDRVLFTYNSSGYKGFGSQTQNTGSATITKLCQITYNDNGKTSGTVPSAQSDKLYNTSVTLSSNDLTKTGYLHTGWNTAPDGGGTHYNKGASITVTAANLTLYAEWTPITISNITLTPSSGTTESHTLRISFTTNVPTDNSYQYAIREFVSNGSSYGAGYQIGATYISSSNITTGEMNPSIFTSSGTYKTQIVILKGGSEVYSSSDITFTIASATDPEWSMWNDNTKLGDFTNNGDGTYTLIVTIPAGGYSLTHYNNDKGFVGAPGAESLTTERTLENTGGRISWQDGAGSFRITIRKDGVTWKIKANKLQTTITLNANSGTGGTSPITASYGSILPSFTKHSRTNYTLTGYWTEASGGTKIINADGTLVANISGYTNGSSQWINTSDALTLHAQWAETKYAVTVGVSDAAHAAGNIACTAAGWVASTSGTAQIGNVTNVTITVPAGATGYTYTGGSWTLTGGVTLVSGSLTSSSITVKATGTGTAIFTYAEVLTTGVYLCGTFNDNGNSDAGWSSKRKEFMKRTGESTGNLSYVSIHLSPSDFTNNTLEVKVLANDWHGNNGTYTVANSGTDWQMGTGDGYTNNLKVTVSVEGDYVFRWNSSTYKLSITYPTVNQLQIYEASPTDATNTQNFDWEGSGTTLTKSLNLNAETTYQFKVVKNSVHLGNNGTMVAGNHTNWTMESDKGNCSLTTTVAGTYTFSFNTTNNQLSITSWPSIPSVSTLSVAINGGSDFLHPFAGNGTENNPYKIFKDQKFKITATASPNTPEDHFYYKYGSTEKAASGTSAFVYEIAAPNNTTKHSLTVEAYFKYSNVKGTSQSQTIWYQGIELPTVTLSASESNVEMGSTTNLTATVTNGDGSESGNNYLFYIQEPDVDNWDTKIANTKGPNSITTEALSVQGVYKFKSTLTYHGRTFESNTISVNSYKEVKITVGVMANAGWANLKFHYWRDGLSALNVASTYITEIDGTKYYSHTFREPYPISFVLYDGTGESGNNISYSDANNHEGYWHHAQNREGINVDKCYIIDGTNYGTYGADLNKKIPLEGSCLGFYRIVVDQPIFDKLGNQTTTVETTSNILTGSGIFSYYVCHNATKYELQQYTAEGWSQIQDLMSQRPTSAEAEKEIEGRKYKTCNGVHNATFDGSSSVSNITKFDGNLYIRSNLAAGGWDDYTQDANKMTHFTPLVTYDYYWVVFSGNNPINTDAQVGNQYNPAISNLRERSDITSTISTIARAVQRKNVRYSYNSYTNWLDLAVIGGSTESYKFLSTYGADAKPSAKVFNLAANNTQGTATNEENVSTQVKFTDLSNWVYQADVWTEAINGSSVTIGIQARLGDGATGLQDLVEREHPLVVLDNTTTTGSYIIRILYDYKTNTITTGWLPKNGENITGNKTIAGNMILNRGETTSVEQLTLNDGVTVSGLRKLYMALKLDKSDLENGESIGEGQYVHYIWFSLPYACKVSDIFGAPGEYPADWEIWEYDGAERARKGLLDDASFFKNVPFNRTLEANKGYCLGLLLNENRFKTIVMDDVARSSIYIYFPSEVEGYTLQNSTKKQLVVPAQYDEAFFTRRPDRKKYDRDWNLVGVPSYNDITTVIEATDPGVEHTHEAASAPGFIYDYAYTTGGDPGSSENNKYKYIAVNSNDANFKYKAFFSYMMQYAGTITWSSNSIENIKAAPAPRKPVRTGEHQLTQATLNLQLLANDEWLDNTFVSLLPKATDKVDHNIDLVKIWNSGSSQLCSLSEDVELAANCLSVDSQTVDLRVYIDNTRTYTFRLEEKVPDGLIALLEDTEAHTLTDLGSDAYTVDLMQGTYDSRFRLHLIVGSSDIGTDIDQLTNSMSYTLYGNELLLNALTEPVRAALYDPAGRLLYQGTVNPGNTINLPDQAGVYLLRLPTQTLRIVK